jgi:D-galactarolactone isomerase
MDRPEFLGYDLVAESAGRHVSRLLARWRRRRVTDHELDDPDGFYAEAAKFAAPPAGSCDCHAQVYGPKERYPFKPAPAPTPTVAPDPDPEQAPPPPDPSDRTVERYRELQALLGFSRVVLVQPSHYGNDHACLIESLSALSSEPGFESGGDARGIAVLRADVEDTELEDLVSAGIIGARFVMLAGENAYDWDTADRLAWRIHDFGWCVVLQMDGSDLHEVEQRLNDWPGPVVIDHIGNFQRTKTLNQRGFKALTRLIDRDKAWVKLSAPYESSRRGRADDPEVSDIARALINWAPERMIWGSNWPHPAVLDNPPDDRMLLKIFNDWVPEQSWRARILRDNPAELFGFGPAWEE